MFFSYLWSWTDCICRVSQVIYQLYGISGRLQAADQIQGQSDALSFDNHEGGIYFLKVSVDNQVVKTFKVVKQ
ncbi:MAG: T9SS type A sorting domain-containing protein [Bacteroidales bacterium]